MHGSQYHYPALAGIVKQTCEDFKIPYRVLPDFRQALQFHIQHLKDLGAQGRRAHVD